MAIAWRIATQRDIDCTPGQVIVQGGTQTSVQNLLALFDGAADTVAIEDPGYDGVRSVIERARFAIAPCRVTEGYDAFLEDLEASGARLVYLTPSSQFPTCRIMPTDIRERVLDWAERTDAYILEDDYCRDFRYRERSLPPLASMDTRGRVIYMGTFSKSLSPALRMNYLVLPEPLLARWRRAVRQLLFAGAVAEPEGAGPLHDRRLVGQAPAPSAGEEPPQVRRPHRRAAGVHG